MSNPELSASGAGEVREPLMATGAQTEAVQVADDITERALTSLDGPSVPAGLQASLVPMAEAVTERVHA